MSSACPACDRAEKNIRTGIFQAGCLPCEARAIALGPEAHAREADPSPLQAVMRRVFNDNEKYRCGRVLVWQWIQRLEKGPINDETH